MKLKLLLFLFTFGISTSVSAEIVLYCNSELATGISKENGIWREFKFKPERFTVKFSDDYSRVKGVNTFNLIWECKKVFLIAKNSEHAECSSMDYPSETFTYNKKTKRFLYFTGASFGYIQDNNVRNDTNSIYAGTCEKF